MATQLYCRQHTRGRRVAQRGALLAAAAALLLAVLAAVAYVRYVVPQMVLAAIRAYDKPLSNADYEYIKRSTAPEICRALVDRVEHANLIETVSDADVLLAKKGLLGIMALEERIDAVIERRGALTSEEQLAQGVDRSLFKLFEALDWALKKNYPGMEFGRFYSGTEAEKQQFLQEYEKLKPRLQKALASQAKTVQ